MRPTKAFVALLAGLSILATPLGASGPLTSVRPMPRPGTVAESPATDRAVAEVMRAAASARAVAASPRPMPRPTRGRIAEAVARSVVVQRPAARVVLASSSGGVQVSPRPDVRPDNIERRNNVVRAGFLGRVFGPGEPRVREGSVCGDNDIIGERVQRIPGRINGCGVEQPVRVTEISGVRLSQASIMRCETAAEFKRWIDGGLKPAVGRLGGGVEGLKIAAHYACRTRNHRAGAKISEHGKGNAIDISAILLRNGVAITVLKGWRDRQHASLMRTLHRTACGPFGTVLGPESDRYHQDHFHFDIARHRGGPYCR